MLIAESRGKVAGDFRAFFMGHRGNIEARYTTNKGILSEILVKEMRQSFERSQEFLDLEIEQTDPILEQTDPILEQTDPILEQTDPILEQKEKVRIILRSSVVTILRVLRQSAKFYLLDQF